MIGGLHWTLLALVELCLGCLLLNAIQWRMVETVRLSGIIVCTGWAIQQAWWAATGSNSLALTLACDLLMLAYFWFHRGSNDWSDWAIFMLTPATMMIYIPEYLTAQTVQGWWLLFVIVAVQMLLGMPRGSKQRIPPEVTHGPMKGRGDVYGFANTRH